MTEFQDDLIVTPHTLREARQRNPSNWNAVVEDLVASTRLDARVVVAQVAKLFKWRYVESAVLHERKAAFDLLALEKALQKDCVLFHDDANGIVAVVANPFDTDLLDWIAAQADQALSYELALHSDIRAYLSKQEESVRTLGRLDQPSSSTKNALSSNEELSFRLISEDSSPIIKIVNSVLYDALKEGASDIHVRSVSSGMHIKYRIDGILVDSLSMDGKETTERVISRIKVMAELDIAERRIPQDGKFQVSQAGRNIDIRVSVMPTIHGEDAVLRILDKRRIIPEDGQLRLELLGFDIASLTTLRQLVSKPYGMLLVTGPTGSGKTTTLYAAISEIHRGHSNFLTIEDPVEYELQGIAQIPVNEKQGLTFASGLRSILRHDPDTIMVGEIRDSETAEIAVQAALTGHMVLTTVHANNVFDVFNRFTYMGIDAYSLTSALNGIWAQRLVRIVCNHCAAEYTPTLDEMDRAGLSQEAATSFQFLRGKGCGDCRGTGYRGRKAIAEVMPLTDSLREKIANRMPVQEIKEEARRNGTRYLHETALNLVKCGETTLEEVARVTLSA